MPAERAQTPFLPVSTPPHPPVTRLAPSPTGALHLGNARTFLVNWAMARRNNWRVILRIEDLDTPRVKPGALEETINTLAWLGMDWDNDAVLVQSHDLAPYRTAMDTLAHAGCAYPCALTRTEIEAAASAPNEGDHETRVPPELRPADLGPRNFDDEHTNWRFVTPPGAITIDDRFVGRIERDPHATVGDFAIWTKRGQPSYQLAVVVDDARQGITEIVRGDDLLDSAARQILIARALGLDFSPNWTHLPLVRGEDGRRLAKRHGDTRLTAYRDAGVPAERVIGLCGLWCGLCAERQPMTAVEFCERFSLDSIPPRDIIFTPEDDAWLRSG